MWIATSASKKKIIFASYRHSGLKNEYIIITPTTENICASFVSIYYINRKAEYTSFEGDALYLVHQKESHVFGAT